MTMLQNRIVYRPVFTSPITLLVNYEGDQRLNTTTDMSTAGVGPWAVKQSNSDQLEWLMRWSQVVTTRIRLKGAYEHTSDTPVPASSQSGSTGSTGQPGSTGNGTSDATPASLTANHSLYLYGGELQLRFYPLEDVSALYIYASAEYKQHDQSGDGAYTAWELIPEAGAIWRLGDKIYLYAKVPFDYKHCLSGATTACTTTNRFVPYVWFTMNL
jgi:hypothetical protein